MASRMQRLVPVFPKLAAAFGALVFTAGSVLVFVIPNPKPKVDEKPETESTASYSIFPKPELWTPDFTPFTPKASPSESKKPKAKASPSPSDSPRDVQPSRDDSPTPGKSDPVKPTTTTKPKATATPTSKPTPTPKPTPTVTPKPTPPTPQPSATTWYTDATAVAAAQRMAASGTVGDPVCSMASVGEPDYKLLPTGLTSVGVGNSGNYWCFIFKQ